MSLSSLVRLQPIMDMIFPTRMEQAPPLLNIVFADRTLGQDLARLVLRHDRPRHTGIDNQDFLGQ